MLGLAHILLHVGLCDAVTRLPGNTSIAMHVKVTYPVRSAQFPDTQFEKVFHFSRGDDPSTEIEFDLPRGLYRLQLDVPKQRCSATDYVNILADHNRQITEALHGDAGASRKPNLLIEGAAPSSFLYVKPTFVVFDRTTTCNQPVGTPLASDIAVENDPDGYYVSLYSDRTAAARTGGVVALRLRTPTGLYHYVRIPTAFPAPDSAWPETVTFDVTEDELDGLATEKTDTLLCPKLWATSVH